MTLNMPQTIAVVMDMQLGDPLAEINSRTRTWILDTPQNKAALKKIPPYELHGSEDRISFFTVDKTVGTEQQLFEILDTVDGHHNSAWLNLKVYGVAPTFLVSDVLKSAYGVIHIEPTPQGFIATRVLE